MIKNQNKAHCNCTLFWQKSQINFERQSKMNYEKVIKILKESLIDAYVSDKNISLTISSIDTGLLIDLQGPLFHFEEKRDGNLLLAFDEKNFIHINPDMLLSIEYYDEDELEAEGNGELFTISQNNFRIDIYIGLREENIDNE